MSNLIDIPHDKKHLVEVILKANDLYKVLHCQKTATTAELTRQYKKVLFLAELSSFSLSFAMDPSSSLNSSLYSP